MSGPPWGAAATLGAPVLVEVAVAAAVRGTFTYRVPAALAGEVSLGSGWPSRSAGARGPPATWSGSRPRRRPASSCATWPAVLDAFPPFTPPLVELLRWAEDYYLVPPGELLRAALPPGLNTRGGARRPGPPRRRVRRPGARGRRGAAHAGAGPGPAGRARVPAGPRPDPGGGAAGRLPAPGAPRSPRSSSAAWPSSTPRRRWPSAASSPPTDRAVALTGDQAAALAAVTGAFGTFGTFLLHGVTGSGKTEVYLQAIAAARAAGKGALVLVPGDRAHPAARRPLPRPLRRRGGAAPLRPLRRRAPRRVAAAAARRGPHLRGGAQRHLRAGRGPGRHRGGRGARAELQAGGRAALPRPRPGGGARPVRGRGGGARLGHAVAGDAGERPARPLPAALAAGPRRRPPHAARRAGRPDRPPPGPPRRAARRCSPPSCRQALGETLAAGQQSILFLNRRGYQTLVLCEACGARGPLPRLLGLAHPPRPARPAALPLLRPERADEPPLPGLRRGPLRARRRHRAGGGGGAGGCSPAPGSRGSTATR